MMANFEMYDGMNDLEQACYNQIGTNKNSQTTFRFENVLMN